MSEQHIQAGRKGVATTLARYGQEHYREIGRKGGRPTWQEDLAKAQASQERARREAGIRQTRGMVRKGGIGASPTMPRFAINKDST